MRELPHATFVMGQLKLWLLFPVALYQMIVTFLPGHIGDVLRYRYWKRRLRHLGKGVRIEPGVLFQGPDYIELDDYCWIDRNVSILAGQDNSSREKIVKRNDTYRGPAGVVHIGKYVHISPSCILSGIDAGIFISDECGLSARCQLYAFSNHYRSARLPGDSTVHFGPLVSEDRQCIVKGPIVLGKNTGLALNCSVLPGVTIPENCFVTINSVVTGGHFHENSIISGNPAKECGGRFLVGVSHRTIVHAAL